ncbi:hypothetical protein E2P81_ATG10963 [Venturia nashicola]|uniref:Uncharacterized protein n=1 Tax=Venturia nashicola TaxID=86259 RepID=A0A4Z1P2C0_9PEZI|nr:hypothetical protein E6O75_ATG10639 [Venturia nashicola]TLD27675.1 hypothetical protein E2P81_ATG10963 [Venturia nashicola]
MTSNSLNILLTTTRAATPSDHPLRPHPVARASDDLSAPPSPANSREEDHAPVAAAWAAPSYSPAGGIDRTHTQTSSDMERTAVCRHMLGRQ